MAVRPPHIMNSIKIRRATGWQDKLRAYKILLDGVVVGEIKQGCQVDLPATAGAHTVQLKVDWCSSPLLRVEVESEKELTLECGPNAKLLLSLLYVTFLCRRYIWLRHA